MSNNIEQNVVEMRFDNRHFESNVQTSLSTIDKLKQKLNFTDSAKGLENVNAAVKNVDMNGLGNAVDTVRERFSALQIVGVTALVNIANSAVNAAKRMIESLTIAPIREGFNEYEMTLNAIQTTMAGTGKTAAEVQEELKKLDEYADKTVYNTADMLNNLPKFTNAGVELETATTAMIGIANATALAGGDANKASIAFYNLGQAIGTGYLTRMDYNSINNAGIATMEWKKQMVEAAIAAGTLTRAGEDLYTVNGKSFTLQQLYIEGLQEQWATTDVLLKVFGDYGDETTEIGEKAYSAAQDIKTFTMMMDSLKATAGTGWKDTWQLIFGDLDGAKALWTGLSNAISKVITGFADWRNGLLESALGRGFGKLSETIKTVLGPMESVTDAVTNAVDAVKDYGQVVDEIINGDWGNGQARWDALTEAGYDWAHAQNLVNEELGVSLRRETSYTEATDAAAESQENLTETESERIAQLADLSYEQLKALNYTDEQIKALHDLRDAADKVGMPIDEFIEKIDEIDGRWLLLESFKNAGKGLAQVFQAIGAAWKDIFPTSTEQRGEQIFNLLAGLHKFSRQLIMDEESLDKLTRTFKGLFALIDIITTIIGGPFKIAFKLIAGVLQYFDLNLLDVTAVMGDAIVRFRDWLDISNLLARCLDKVIPYLQKAAIATKEWFKSLVAPGSIGGDLIAGLVNGIKSGATKIWDAAKELAMTLWESFCDFMGIHSPSTKMEEAGGHIIDGLFNGLKNGVFKIFEFVADLANGIIDIIGSIDIGKISSLLASAGILTFLFKLARLIGAIASPLEGLGDIFENFAKVVKQSAKVVKQSAKVVKAFAGVLKSISTKIMASALKDIAIAIAILVGSIALLTFLDTKKVIISSVVIIAFVGALTALMKSLGAMDKTGAAKIAKTVALLWGLAGAIAVLVIVGKILSGMEWSEMGKAATGILGLVGIITLLMLVSKLGNAKKIGIMLMQMAGALAILTVIAKVLAGMEWSEMGKAGAGLLGLVGIVTLLMLVSKLANFKKVGIMLMQVAGAIAILAITAKIIAGMEWSEMGKAAVGLLGLVGVITLLMLVSKLGNAKKIGTMLMQIAGAMAILTITSKIIATMEWSEMGKAAIGLLGLVGVIALLVSITKLASEKELNTLGKTLLAMSASIAILAIVAAILGLMDLGSLAKGVAAVGALAVMVSLMVAATKNAKDCSKTILMMAIAIGVMAVAVTALSFINPSSLWTAVGALVALMGVFALMELAVKNVGKDSIGSLAVMTAAIAIMAYAVWELAQLPIKSTLGAAGALSMMMLALAGAMAIISKVDNIKIAPLATMIVAVGLLGGLLYLLAPLPISSTLGAVLALSVMLLALSAAMKIISTIDGSKMVGKIISMTLAVGVIGAMIYLVGQLPLSSALGAAGALSLTLLALAGAMAIISKVDNIKIAPLAIMVVAVGLLGSLLYLLAPLPISATLGAAAALSVMLLALSASMVILSNIKSVPITTIITLLAATAALAVLANAIIAIGAMSGGASLQSILTLGAALVILAIGLNVMNGTLAGSAALLIAAVALNVLAPALMLLGGLSWAEIGKGLLVLAGSFLILGVAGLLLGPLVPVIIGLAAAIALVGVGILGIGAGISLMGAGLKLIAVGFTELTAAISTNAPMFVAGLAIVIQGLLDMIPMVIEALGNALVLFCQKIIEAAPIIGQTVVTIATTVISMLTTVIPLVVEAIGQLLNSLLQTVAKYMPTIIQTGFDIILGILKGIRDNISEVVQTAIEIVIEFIDGVAQKIPDVIQAAIDLMLSFINGLADGIRNNQQAVINAVNNLMDAIIGAVTAWFSNIKEKGGELVNKLKAGLSDKVESAKNAVKDLISDMIDKVKEKFEDWENIGKDMIDGFIQGVKDKARALVDAATGIVEDAIDAVTDLLDVNSPSKVFAEIGMWTDLGFVAGLEAYASRVSNSARDVASGAVDAFSSTISRVSSAIGSDIDTQPTIRPVLDLSDVADGAASINGMFGMTPSVGVWSNIGAVNTMMHRRQNGANNEVVSAINDLKKVIGDVPGDTYTFGNITYNDDSVVSTAVESLIRAIRVERRV